MLIKQYNFELTIVLNRHLTVELHGLPVVVLYRGFLLGATPCATAPYGLDVFD